MPSLPFSRVGRNLLDIAGSGSQSPEPEATCASLRPFHGHQLLAQVFIAFAVLLFSLTFHELAHAWTADRLGDPTARLLGRVSFNPIVHADPIGTVLFPLLALIGSLPIIGWAKPVPVDISRLQPAAARLRARRGGRPGEQSRPGGRRRDRLCGVIPIARSCSTSRTCRRPIVAFLSLAISFNVLLAVFNMLPIPPLDGGNVLSGLLPSRFAAMLDQVQAVRLSHPVRACCSPTASTISWCRRRISCVPGFRDRVDDQRGARRFGDAADGTPASRTSGRRARQLGAAAGAVRLLLFRRRLARADERLRRHRPADVGTRFDNVADWIGAGLDPEKSTFFIQSLVPEHAELYLLLSMVVPDSVARARADLQGAAGATSRTRICRRSGFSAIRCSRRPTWRCMTRSSCRSARIRSRTSSCRARSVRRFNNCSAAGRVLVEPQPLLTPVRGCRDSTATRR